MYVPLMIILIFIGLVSWGIVDLMIRDHKLVKKHCDEVRELKQIVDKLEQKLLSRMEK